MTTDRKPVLLVVRPSTMMPDLLSLRTVDGKGAQHIKQALVDAGYQDGDIVEIRLAERPMLVPEPGSTLKELEREAEAAANGIQG